MTTDVDGLNNDRIYMQEREKRETAKSDKQKCVNVCAPNFKLPARTLQATNFDRTTFQLVKVPCLQGSFGAL